MNRVAWTSGTFLSQQHLQQSEMYWARQHQERERLHSPHAWGIEQCVFDDAALSVEQVRVLKLSVVFPDRSLIEFDANHDAQLVCNIKEEGVVYLQWDGGAQLTGWNIEEQYVPDAFDAYRESEISVLKPELSLAMEQSVGLPIARIKKLNDQYVFDENFIPPSVQVRASSALMRLSDRVSLKIHEVLSMLHTLRDRYEGRAAFDKCMWLSLFLSRILVELENSVSPYELYKILCECDAILCAYHKSDMKLVSYHHAKFEDEFYNLEKSIFKNLAHLFPSGYESISLDVIGKSLYVARDLSPDVLSQSTFILGLEVHGRESLSVLNSQIKVADATRISGLVNSALPGVLMHKIEQFPHELMVKPGFDYFYLEQRGNLWESVLHEKSLAVFLPETFHGCRVELLMMME